MLGWNEVGGKRVGSCGVNRRHVPSLLLGISSALFLLLSLVLDLGVLLWLALIAAAAAVTFWVLIARP